MRWPWQSADPPPKKPINWADTLNATDWEHYTSPQTVIPTVILTGGILFTIRVYRLYLKRIPGASYVRPGAFRKRSIFGKVTRVGDGDNFHLYHTPGGRLTGWGWLRRVPEKAVDLKKRTIAIRIAGVDAPEAAHFGNEAQPYSKEALDWLQNYILGKRVRARIYKRDQYDRVVATVFVWKGLLRRDVGKEMLKAGWATVYDAKSGSEFGGKEEKYRKIEQWAKNKKRGMWAGNMNMFESPREYKTRTGANPETSKAKAGTEPEAGGVLAKIFGAKK